MAIEKHHILDEIKRVTKANGGKAPGRRDLRTKLASRNQIGIPIAGSDGGMHCRKQDLLPTSFKRRLTKRCCWENLLALSVSWDTSLYTEKFVASPNRTRCFPAIRYLIVWVGSRSLSA